MEEVADFVDFMLKKHEDFVIQNAAQQLMAESKTFDFLNDKEDIYSFNDLKEKF